MENYYGLATKPSQDYYGLIRTTHRPEETNRPKSRSRGNSAKERTLWWVQMSGQGRIQPTEPKFFLNDYQLIEDKKKPKMVWGDPTNRRDGRVHSSKIIRYRRSNSNSRRRIVGRSTRNLPSTENTPQSQTTNNSNFLKIQRANLSDVGNYEKNPSHSLSTRSVSKNFIPKENPEPHLDSPRSALKFNRRTQSFSKNFESTQNHIKASVIKQEIQSDDVPSIIKGNKMDSKISCSQTGRIKLKNSFSGKNSMMLSINSKKSSRRSSRTMGASSCQYEGYMLIDSHLETLNILAEYSQGIIQNYEDVSQWEELIFLVYKKFYLERKKLVSALKFKEYSYFPQIYTNSNQGKYIRQFLGSLECKQLRRDLEQENFKILESLRNLYNLAIQKSGDYINMIETDNFSNEIFKFMAEEIQELQPLYDMNREEVGQRVKLTLNCAAQICKLNSRQEELELRKFSSMQITKSLFSKILQFFAGELIER